MKNDFKLYKWKKYMWVIFNAERPDHGSEENQDDFLPGLYSLLDEVKNCKSSRKVTADLTLSDKFFDEADIDLELIDDFRYKIISNVVTEEYIWITNRVLKYFPEYPKKMFLHIT